MIFNEVISDFGSELIDPPKERLVSANSWVHPQEIDESFLFETTFRLVGTKKKI